MQGHRRKSVAFAYYGMNQSMIATTANSAAVVITSPRKTLSLSNIDRLHVNRAGSAGLKVSADFVLHSVLVADFEIVNAGTSPEEDIFASIQTI